MFWILAHFFDIEPNEEWKLSRGLLKFLDSDKCLVLLVRQIDGVLDFETEVSCAVLYVSYEQFQ